MTEILIVDNNLESSHRLQFALNDAGFGVQTTSNAHSALELTKKSKYDLALLDMATPEQSGLESLKQLRGCDPLLKIIAISSGYNDCHVAEAMRLGADEYLIKPLDMHELMLIVRRLIKETRFNEFKGHLDVDVMFNLLSNTTRRQILLLLKENSGIRFMDITRALSIDDHTKMNFHLRNLRKRGLILQDNSKLYRLSPEGKRITACLETLIQTLKS